MPVRNGFEQFQANQSKLAQLSSLANTDPWRINRRNPKGEIEEQNAKSGLALAGSQIDEFIQWYCSEPRLSFNKIVVTRYRIFLENRGLAPGTVNGHLDG
jgi:hypothetical protein